MPSFLVGLSRGVLVGLMAWSCWGGLGRAAELFPKDAVWEKLWDDGEFTEGVAVAPDGRVYFSDISVSGKHRGRILRFDPSTKQTTVFVPESGQSNGLFFTPQGTLWAACGAQRGHRALCHISAEGGLHVVVDRFENKRFNAPNDLVVHPRGWLYFSDPRYVGSEPLELEHQSVYRYDPTHKTLARVTFDTRKPNGVILSPDGNTLYVADTDNGVTGVEPPGQPPQPPYYALLAYPVLPDGRLGPKRVLAEFPDMGIDGMTCDAQGRIFAAFRQPQRPGILVFAPQGQEIAHRPLEPLPTNCCFGVGAERHVLYVTAGTALYRISTLTQGVVHSSSPP